MNQQKHTILLVQPTPSKNSRTYYDYESIALCMDGIAMMFEQKLKQEHPRSRKFTYDVGELFQYVDSLPDLGVLVFNPQSRAYIPYNKDWIKNQLFQYMKRHAS